MWVILIILLGLLMAKLTLNAIGSRYGSIDALNDNSDLIEAAFENTLSRDGTGPNNMEADLDMDSNDIINVGSLSVGSLRINGQPISPGTVNYTGMVKQTIIATAGQTVFNLTTISYAPLTNNLSVYVDGVYQNPSRYTETNSTRVTLSEGVHVGAVVDFVVLALTVIPGTVDASNVTYTPAGSGVVNKLVSDKLQEIVSRADYNSDVNFNNAKGIKPNIDGSGNFNAKVTPTGEGTQISLSDALLSSSGMQRGRVNYFSGTEVEVIVPDDVVMGGFRFMGNYKKKRAPTYSSGVSYRAVVSNVSNLGAESTAKVDNWYAVFACANDGDTSVTYKLMPFIRVGSVAGSVCTLNYGGENSHTITPITYTWSNNELTGVDCLVINEGSENRFSGRVTTISANTTTTVTLNTIGSVGAYDYLLPAPPGFDHYCYLGTFYNDVASAPYNIADGATSAMAYMSQNQDPNWTASGAVAGPSGDKIMWGGYISPLASGVILQSTLSTSTSGGGDIYTNFSHDSSNHVIGVHSYYKEAAASSSTQIAILNINFSVGQFMYYWVNGPLAAQRTNAQIRALGWIEP